MITVQYQRIPLLLHEDEKLHLEALEQEAKEICQQLKGSVHNDSTGRKSEGKVQTAD